MPFPVLEKCEYGVCDGHHPPCRNCGFFHDYSGSFLDHTEVARLTVDPTDAQAQQFVEGRGDRQPIEGEFPHGFIV